MSTTSAAPSTTADAPRRIGYCDIWTIAFPILLSSLVEQIIGITDTAFLGRVGEIELGGSALGGVFFISVFMLIWGFCSGAQILMGRRNGEGRYAELGTVFYHSLGFLSLVTIGLWTFTHFCAPSILRLIISSPEVYEAAWTYLDWRMWGVFFTMVAVLFRAFYVATTRTSVLKYNSIVMVLANVLFDYLLIFGHWGFPEMGIAGAAIASAAASFFSMLYFLVYTVWKGDAAKYALNRLPKFKPRLLVKMLSVSIWMMVQSFLSLTTWFLFFIAIEHIGPHELAVTNVLRSISGFTFMSLIALASTASTLTSNLLGSGDVPAIRPMLFRAILMGFFISAPVWTIILLFPEAVIRIFTPDVAIIASGVPPLYILGASYIFQVPGQILFMSVSGTGNTRTALAIEVLSLVVYVWYVWYFIYELRSSLSVAWGSEVIYAFIILIFSYAYFRWGNWHHKQI